MKFKQKEIIFSTKNNILILIIAKQKKKKRKRKERRKKSGLDQNMKAQTGESSGQSQPKSRPCLSPELTTPLIALDHLVWEQEEILFFKLVRATEEGGVSRILEEEKRRESTTRYS